MAKSIRVLFINCPSLAAEAAAFLILAQNQAQSAIQFEVEHFWIYAAREIEPIGWRNRVLEAREDGILRSFIAARLKRKYRSYIELQAAPGFANELNSATWLGFAEKAIEDYDAWLSTTYLKKKPRTQTVPTIIITETALKGGYLSYAKGDFGVISIANWKKYFSPGSGLEFMLTAVQRQSLWISYRATGVGSHFPTRGCVWDFHGYQADSRISSFLGFLCEECRKKLASSISDSEYEEIEKLLANKWIGSDEEDGTIARILKKNYGYYLSRSSGLRPGIIAPVKESVKTESGKAIADIGKWAVILFITLVALTYFPDVTKRLKDFFSGKAEVSASPSPTPSPTPSITAESPASPTRGNTPSPSPIGTDR